MGLFGWVDPVDEANNDKDAQTNIDSQKKFEKLATPQQAQAVAQIYRQSPWVPPRVILDLAKANATQQAIDAVANVTGKQYVMTNTPQKKQESGNWFQREVYGKAKALSRWTFAALQFTPDLAQNAASQLFSGNDPAGVDGWFASTQLGQMAGSKDAGTGFFFGGEAQKTQAQKAREFRGTINGNAWTIGRGAADMVFTPGSKEYSLLSGFLDAGVNIFADPTLFAGQALKAAKTGQAVKGIPGTRKASQALANQLVERGVIQTDAIPAITREAGEAAARIARGEAGLEARESIAFVESRFYTWFDRNARAGRMADRLAEHARTATDNITTRALTGADADNQYGRAAAKILEDFGDRIDPEVAMRLARADSPLKVKAIIGEAAAVLAREQGSSLLPRSISDVTGTGATFAARQYARERVPLYRSMRNSRFWSEIPTQQAIINGTGMQRSKSIGTYRKWMQGLKINEQLPETYEKFLGKAMNAFSIENTATRREATEKLYDEFLEIITEHAGGDISVAKKAVANIRADKAKLRTYGIDQNGQLDDGGIVQFLRQYTDPEEFARFDPVQIEQLRLQGPSALVELVDHVQVLPDYRKFRAITGNKVLRHALRTKDGRERALIAASEQLQQEVWKPMVLATGGYIVRNLIDSHIRIGARGYESFFTHPFHFIQTVMGRRYVGPLTGKMDPTGANVAVTFEEALDDVTGALNDIFGGYKESVQRSVYQHLQDPLAANESMFRSENFTKVSRMVDPDGHTTGYVDNLGQIASDPILSRVAALWNLPQAERTEQIVRFLDDTPEGIQARQTIVDYFRNGVRITDESGQPMFVRFTSTSDTALIAGWVDRAATARVSTILRGDSATNIIDEDLRFIVGYNRVPLMENVRVAGEFTDEAVISRRAEQMLDSVTYVAGEPNNPRGVGGLVNLPDDRQGVIVAIRENIVEDPFNPGSMVNREIAEIQPVAPGRAFTTKEKDPGLFGAEALREHINYKGAQGRLAETVKVAARVEKGKTVGLDKISQALDTGVKWFFNSLVGRSTQSLERSPLYRQAFYKEVADKAFLLSPEEQLTLRANITRYVDELNNPRTRTVNELGEEVVSLGRQGNLTVEQYVGNRQNYDAIFNRTATGDATIAELEQFASGIAVQELQDILYNAQQKSNFEDMLRVIAPFATAFRETLTKYTGYLIEDPSRIRKTQLAYNAVNYNSDDPDNIGAGWFDKDAVSGKHVFNFPIGGWAGPLLQFPVRGAFQVLSVPGVGPVAQIAASNLIPDTPRLDFIRSMVLPYGKQGISSFAPSWARRGIEAIKADTTNMETIYGNTYAETVKYLASSGEYDLNDPNDTAKLYADAKGKARILAGLRALFQFTGPASPQIDFRLETDGGDIVASAISQEFYKFQTENPDNAVQRFIETFGEDAFIYLGHKTEPIAGGLEASEAFGDWQRNNGGLFEQYKQSAGYFAPGGDDFSFETWNRQIQKGQRRRLSAPEIVAAAQYRLGAAVYRSKRNQLGDRISSEQRDWLTQWRVFLNSQYPGFPAKANFNPGEFDSFIGELKQAVQDDRLGNNEVAQAVKEYIAARDKALAQAGAVNLKSLDSVRAEPLRDWLSSIAQVLIQRTPEFSRIFEDKLAAEVD
jgi:hypothetical protein